MCVKSDRKCCYFTSGDPEAPSRQERQDKARQDEDLYANAWVCTQGPDPGAQLHMCTTPHLSQDQEVQSTKCMYIEGFLQTV